MRREWMMGRRFALLLCGAWLAGCVPEMDNRVWLDIDGRPVESERQARRLADARQLCHVIEDHNGILGDPGDVTSSCMAAQGFTLTQTFEAQTRPIVPGGQ
jgi:hypothetical protein